MLETSKVTRHMCQLLHLGELDGRDRRVRDLRTVHEHRHLRRELVEDPAQFGNGRRWRVFDVHGVGLIARGFMRQHDPVPVWIHTEIRPLDREPRRTQPFDRGVRVRNRQAEAHLNASRVR